jgi:hypothetical protein
LSIRDKKSTGDAFENLGRPTSHRIGFSDRGRYCMSRNRGRVGWLAARKFHHKFSKRFLQERFMACISFLLVQHAIRPEA